MERLGVVALTLGLALLWGCTGGTTDPGRGGGLGGSGGVGGLGGSGGVGGASAGLGWCAAEAIGTGEMSQRETDIATDALGNVVAVWRDSGGYKAVWSNRWTPNEGWGTAEPIQTQEGPSVRPRVAADANGNVVAIWEQSDCASSYDIWSRRWTPSEGWGPAERIDMEDGQTLYPEVAIDSSGNVFAVWTQADGVGGPWVWANRWTQGDGWGMAERVQTNDVWAYDAQVVVDPTGNALATWRERTDEGLYELWLSHWTRDEGWGAPERAETTKSVGKYQMAVDPSGHAIAVWSAGRGQGFDRGIWSARWTGAWEADEQVVDDRRTRDPKVAFDANGNATAAWMYWAGADTGGARIWAGRWTPDEGWDGITQLHGVGSSGRCDELEGLCTDGWSWDPALTVDGNGSALVAWAEVEEDADGQRLDIWSRRWTSGQGWGDAERVDDRDRGVGPPQVAFDATGTGVAAWSQEGTLWSSRFERGCGNDGAGGAGGMGGIGGDRCEGVVCPDTECRSGGACDPDDGTCTYAMVADDATACSEGECVEGGCGVVGAFACTEQGIRDAIAAGGGPRFFACDEAVPVVLTEPLVFDNDVILDGEGELVLEGRGSGTIRVEAERNVELRALRAVSDGYSASLDNLGTLAVADSTVDGVSNYNATLTLTDTEVRRVAVYNLGGVATLTRVRISASDPYSWGGGIHNSGGTVSLIDSTITGSGKLEWHLVGGIYNSHTFEPGGQFREGVLIIEGSTISGNAGYLAGGIYNNGASLTLINSTVSGNTAGRGPSIQSWTWRGGSVTVANSTVSGSAVEYECGSEYNGYGIGNKGTLTVTNSTLAGNAFGGLDNRGEATVTNSIIDGGCAQYGDDSVMTSGGYNIVGGSDGCGFDDPTDMVDVSSSALALGSLSDNGGPTMTYALLAGSVAIDVIPAPMCEVAEDQRGEPRPAGGMCDVGAFEVQP
jgi:hypothetical protein